MKNSFFNISKYLPEMAEKRPGMKAVVFPHTKDSAGRRSYISVTFSQINQLCDRYAIGMSSYGIRKNMKVLLMVKPSIDFIALTWALFKIGAVPVMIDPGMGRKRLLECIKKVSPEAVVGIPLAHAVRTLFPRYFKSVNYNVIVGPKIPFLGVSLYDISKEQGFFRIADTRESSPAAVLFTSGSTGPAKGVIYEHGMFNAQVQVLKGMYNFQPDEVDLACFPLFALFDAALSMTCIIPDMDPSKPAQVNPQNIAEAITDHNVTTTFGSPAIWKRVSEYCKETETVFPSIKRILIAGAPVPYALIQDFKKHIPNGDVHTPYGATESLPVATVSGQEVVTDTWKKTYEGAGICVGRTVEEVALRIIGISDSAVENWYDGLEIPQGEIGEITVSGPQVTKKYYRRSEDTKNSKIYEYGKTWHRIGDVGYFDESGRLWFCGRKAHRVETESQTLFSVQCEAIFNHHPNVSRSALAGVGPRGQQIPVMFVEPVQGSFPKTDSEKQLFIEELIGEAKKYPHTSLIRHIFFQESFPVDVRHNAKINRENLSELAEKLLEGKT